MAETAGAHFEAEITHEPLSEPGLRSSRLWRNLVALVALPLDPLGSASIYKPKVQHVVRVRRRDTRQTVARFEYLDGEEAAAHLHDLRSRMEHDGTAGFCRSLGIQFPGV